MVTLWPSDPLALAGLLLILAGIPLVLSIQVSKSYGLAVLMLIVFGLQLYGSTRPGGDTVTLMLGMQADALFAGDSWWTPLTMMFVHANIQHIAGNLMILLVAGPVIEQRLGEKAFVIVFFVAGLGSALAGAGLAAFAPSIVPGYVIMIGASGAIFGVLTAVAFHYPKQKLPVWLILLMEIPAFLVLMIYLAFNVIYMLTGTGGPLETRRGPSGIAWYGHFAGFIVGLLAAPFLPKRAGRELRGRVDVSKLEPLATDREKEEMLQRLGTIKGETHDDAAFQDAWLERFFRKAACPKCGDTLSRDGFTASCPRGDYSVDFAEGKPSA